MVEEGDQNLPRDLYFLLIKSFFFIRTFDNVSKGINQDPLNEFKNQKQDFLFPFNNSKTHDERIFFSWENVRSMSRIQTPSRIDRIFRLIYDATSSTCKILAYLYLHLPRRE